MHSYVQISTTACVTLVMVIVPNFCDHLCIMVQLLFEVMCLICTYATTLVKLYLCSFYTMD